MKPGIQRILTRWIPGFMLLWQIRGTRIAVLEVPP